MAEKKTAEIKFRIEPSRKARFQQAAADEGIGLSEFLVLAAEDRAKSQEGLIRAGDVLPLESHAVMGDKIIDMHTGEEIRVFAAPSSNPFADLSSVTTPDAAPTKCGDGAVQEDKWFSPEFKPWEVQ